MGLSFNQDIMIDINVPQPDGTKRKLFLREIDSVDFVPEIAKISKRVAMCDTADLIFRLFVKAEQGDADLEQLSKRIPCLGKGYLPKLQALFKQPMFADALKGYIAATDKLEKREIRKRVIDELSKYVEKNISPQDLQFNFSKFQYTGAPASSLKGKLKDGAYKLTANMLGQDVKDPFVMGVYKIWADNIHKRVSTTRKAYWMLIRDESNKVIGMTCISTQPLKDKLVDKDIVGHSGYILDPSVQGRGYMSAISAVMIDFIYDNMDKEIAQKSLFSTTCDEFNEISQGMQKKSGAHLLIDADGKAIIESGKMHWYATKEEMLNSELIKQARERNIEYSVDPVISDVLGYTKVVGKSQHRGRIDMNLGELRYERA